MTILFVFLAFLSLNISIHTSSVFEDHLKNVDHMKLSSSRIIIDDAISESQLKSLMTYINHDPILSKGDALTYVPEAKIYSKYSYHDLHEVYQSFHDDMRSSRHGHIMSTDRREKVLNYTTTQTYIHIMKDIVSVQLQILDYAEAFFNRKLRIKCGTLFARRHAKIDNLGEYSPRELNNASGWLVPVHVDGCKFREDLWACDPSFITKHEEQDYRLRNVSVVMFLNELEEEAGGELVFVDAPGRTVGTVSSRSPDRNLQQQHRLQEEEKDSQQNDQQMHDRELSTYRNTHTHLDYYETARARDTGGLIPPPSRAQIRRAREKQRRQLEDTEGDSSKITKTIPVYERGINYTVVTPKVRRLVIFNSSAENIHAVTQILNTYDRRYTLFMFISEIVGDN